MQCLLNYSEASEAILMAIPMAIHAPMILLHAPMMLLWEVRPGSVSPEIIILRIDYTLGTNKVA